MKTRKIIILLIAVVAVANTMVAQTLFNETFGSAAIWAPYAGGTSTTPAGINYTQGSNGNISTIFNGTDTYLNFASNFTNGKPYLTAAFSDIASGLNAASLTSNAKLVTWTVNMRVSRTMTNSSNTYGDGTYYLAVVLCSSSPNIIDGTVSGSVGYALILQRSLNNPTSLNPSAVRLVKFQNGIGSSATTGSIVSAALLTTPALNSGAAATTAAPNNVSIKVEYNADYDSWTMYYREDPIAGGFADPSTGTYTKIGNVTDATYTATAMTHFGYLASVGTSTSVANQYQIDNFKIALSDFPAFTPTPNIERRQAIHNSPAPTVASLAHVGTNVKYYAAATGGSSLASTTAISTGYYYVTQTIAGIESDRLATYVYTGETTLKTLPLYEPFNYPLSTATTASIDNKLVLINNDLTSGTGYGPWSVAATVLPVVLTPDDMVLTYQPAAWTSTVLPAPTGNAVTFAGSGLDPQLLFDAPTSGSVYASCLLQVTNLNSITSGTSGLSTDIPSAPEQVFSFAYADPAVGSATSYTAAGYLKSSTITPGAFNIGINAAPAETIGATDIVWSATDFAINTPITVVIQYSYDNNISKLWINPTSAAESEATATTIARAVPLAVNRVRLTQGNNARTPFVTIDEIRVANNYSYVTGGPNISVNTVPASPTASAQTFCGTATVANLVATGTDLKWYANATAGTAMTSSQAITTQTYYVSQTINNVESARTAVEVTVTIPATTSAIRMVPATTAIPSVTIGTQTWTSKNLDVSTYRDGTPIPQVTDPTAWANLTTGAWCYYNNDPANGATYGKLYNWYAVAGIHDNDPNTPNKVLGQTGWHVPSDAEWTTLTSFLGGENVAGGKMKETGNSHWNSPNIDATNSSGFTGLPGAYRTFSGIFFNISYNGSWWSSLESNTSSGFGHFVGSDRRTVTRVSLSKISGFSVRLIKD